LLPFAIPEVLSKVDKCICQENLLTQEHISFKEPKTLMLTLSMGINSSKASHWQDHLKLRAKKNHQNPFN